MRRLVVLVAVLAVGCAVPRPAAAPAPSIASTTTSTFAPPSEIAGNNIPVDVTPAPTTAPTGPALWLLDQLAIDDHPNPGGVPYDRADWPHWWDPDRNGCDAREDLLIATSTTPATVGRGCAVTGGHWVSAYDGATTDQPSTFDVDHLVSLSEAHRSGGWAWTVDQRTTYANDPAVLILVSASSNRSKGDASPDQWRPPSHDVWCSYATRFASIKITYHLTATSSERDALGSMLDTCPKG